MTPPSYVGPEVTAICSACGHVQLIADPEAIPREHNGVCGDCDGLTDKEVWRGPVAPRES